MFACVCFVGYAFEVLELALYSRSYSHFLARVLSLRVLRATKAKLAMDFTYIVSDMQCLIMPYL